MSRSLLIRLVSGVLALALLLIAARAAWGVYRRSESEVRLLFGGAAWQTEGTITEALIEERADSLVPFPVRTHVLRYTFPAPPVGTALSGEQAVTRRAFEQMGQQGDPVTVWMSQTDPRINAVVPRPAFPASAGYWLALTAAALVGAVGVITGGLLLSRQPATRSTTP